MLRLSIALGFILIAIFILLKGEQVVVYRNGKNKFIKYPEKLEKFSILLVKIGFFAAFIFLSIMIFLRKI